VSRRRVDLSAWRPTWSPVAATRALRAAVVMPALFALTDQAIGNLQMGLFAAFGSFANLVLVSFAGTPRNKLRAHLALALAGSLLLTIGTLVSSSTALAALVTVPVAFAVFFAGVTGPNAAAGVTGTLLLYVLPAASPGTASMIPDRLAGWWLACAVGTAAVLLFPTPTAANRLRAAISTLSRALAAELTAALAGEATDESLHACIAAKHDLLATFNATPFRPTGLADRDQALANAVELLEWCTALIADGIHERDDLRGTPAAERELIEQTAAVLAGVGEMFAGARALEPAALEALEASRRRSLAGLHELRASRPDFEAQTHLAFHAHTAAMTALAIGADALVTEGLADEQWLETARARWTDGLAAPRAERLGGLSRYAGLAARHASVRSVWLINSLRGAVALAAAVLVADLSSVQHGFWVVLGTLSVLRTNAASTGSTAVRAILGTALGFVAGAALLLAIGTGTTALWIVLPFAVLVAAYAPGAAPFTVGQAAFTVTVAVLFNILVPVGWKVGELRIEDVAIGCVVSVVVGALFWPRGVSSLVGDDLADAYRAGSAYLAQAVDWVSGARDRAPDEGPTAGTAGLRLDEALRAFLAEQGTKHLRKEELWRLVGGSLRLRLTARAVAGLPRECARDAASGDAVLRERTEILHAWFEQLAAQVGRPRGTEPALTLAAPTWDGAGQPNPPRSHRTVWLHEHLDHLSDHLEELVAPAARLAEVRRGPWWR
jgi:uncharacterized membrane protein YccC